MSSRKYSKKYHRIRIMAKRERQDQLRQMEIDRRKFIDNIEEAENQIAEENANVEVQVDSEVEVI